MFSKMVDLSVYSTKKEGGKRRGGMGGGYLKKWSKRAADCAKVICAFCEKSRDAFPHSEATYAGVHFSATCPITRGPVLIKIAKHEYY